MDPKFFSDRYPDHTFLFDFGSGSNVFFSGILTFLPLYSRLPSMLVCMLWKDISFLAFFDNNVLNWTFFREIVKFYLSFRTVLLQIPFGSGAASFDRIRIHNTAIRYVIYKVPRIQCCGSGMFIPDPGSWFLPILDPGSRIPDPKTATKERGEKNLLSYHFL